MPIVSAADGTLTGVGDNHINTDYSPHSIVNTQVFEIKINEDNCVFFPYNEVEETIRINQSRN